MVSMSSCWLITLLLIMLAANAMVAVTAQPPGILIPSKSHCDVGKFKICKNLVHVCPKFCAPSGGCTTHCQSCKPICNDGTFPPPDAPPTPVTLTPPTTHRPPPPPTTPHRHPPPPTTHRHPPPTTTHRPPPPTTTPHRHPPPPTTHRHPPPTTTHRPPPPPPPPTTTPHRHPPPTTTHRPPPPPPPPSSSPTPITQSPPPPSPNPTPITQSPPPPSSTPTPPSSDSAGKKRAKCKIKNSECYNVEFPCPDACPGGCQVDCISCKPVCSCDMPGAVCQDPRFIGADGIAFYFHGKKDREFCLVSDANLHINGHFIGKRDPTMTRDFTWVESIGILFNDHKMFLGAKKTAAWDDLNDRLAITFNGEPIFLQDREGAIWQSEYSSPPVSITRIASANSVVVEAQGNFRITVKVVPITQEDSRVHNYGVTEDDCFAHLDLTFKFFSLSADVDGVLGRTYASGYVSKVNMKNSMPVLGGEREFATSSLFAADCSASRFRGGTHKFSGGLGMEFPSLTCGDHIDGGAGVVCKR